MYGRPVLALNMRPFRCVNVVLFFGSNLASSIRDNTAQLPRALLEPRVKMSPSVVWNKRLI